MYEMIKGNDRVVIWGAGGHAKVVADIIRLEGKYDLVGFYDDSAVGKDNTSFEDSVVRAGEEGLGWLKEQGELKTIIAIGKCKIRLEKAKLALEYGWTFVNAIHPSAVVARTAKLGTGIVLVAGAVINPGSSVGEHCIINTCASVGHDCILAAGVHAGPGVRIAGNSEIGEATWIGVGSSVKDEINIGSFCCIGAGSVVVKDIPPNSLAYGVPATPKLTKGSSCPLCNGYHGTSTTE